MDSYLAKTKEEHICGIAAEHWLAFFKAFQDRESLTEVREQIKKIEAKMVGKVTNGETASLLYIKKILTYLYKIIDEI